MRKIVAIIAATYVMVSAGMSVAVSNGCYEVLDYKGPLLL